MVESKAVGNHSDSSLKLEGKEKLNWAKKSPVWSGNETEVLISVKVDV